MAGTAGKKREVRLCAALGLPLSPPRPPNHLVLRPDGATEQKASFWTVHLERIRHGEDAAAEDRVDQVEDGRADRADSRWRVEVRREHRQVGARVRPHRRAADLAGRGQPLAPAGLVSDQRRRHCGALARVPLLHVRQESVRRQAAKERALWLALPSDLGGFWVSWQHRYFPNFSLPYTTTHKQGPG